MTATATSAEPLPPNVRAMAATSFLADVSSEMVYPLLPVFVATTLGAGAASVGVIEGAAEATAAVLKVAGGWWSDRVARRKPLAVAGYALAALARPFVSLAGSASHVLAVRLTDRVGKGIRTAPRDALLADSVPDTMRGRAFGVHRAADHAGAVLGSLVAAGLVHLAGFDLRTVFALSVVPGLLAVAALAFGTTEPARTASGPRPRLATLASLEPRFLRFLGVLFLFSLGNSTDAFLILRATDLGVPVAAAPVLWAALHVVKSASSAPAGTLSDRVGRRPVIVAGWAAYAAVYAGFAFADAAWHAWALFAAYGVFHGLTEPVEKALVADLVPAERRGTDFGWYHLTLGIAALPASVVFGAIWDRAGAPAAFATGAAVAVAATALLVLLVRRAR